MKRKPNGKKAIEKLQLEPMYVGDVLDVIRELERTAAYEVAAGAMERAMTIRAGVLMLSRLVHGEPIVGPLGRVLGKSRAERDERH